MGMGVCLHACQCTMCELCLQRLDEGVRLPGAGVIECSKLPDVGSGN